MACHHLPSVRCTECAYGEVTIYPTAPPQTYTYNPPATPYKCPVCEGRGTVEEGFYGDDHPVLDPTKCRTCWGVGVIWQPSGLNFTVTNPTVTVPGTTRQMDPQR